MQRTHSSCHQPFPLTFHWPASSGFGTHNCFQHFMHCIGTFSASSWVLLERRWMDGGLLLLVGGECASAVRDDLCLGCRCHSLSVIYGQWSHLVLCLYWAFVFDFLVLTRSLRHWVVWHFPCIWTQPGLSYCSPWILKQLERVRARTTASMREELQWSPALLARNDVASLIHRNFSVVRVVCIAFQLCLFTFPSRKFLLYWPMCLQFS